MEKEHQVLAEVIADVIGSVGGYKSNNGKRVRQLLCESLGGDWQSSSKKNKRRRVLPQCPARIWPIVLGWNEPLARGKFKKRKIRGVLCKRRLLKECGKGC